MNEEEFDDDLSYEEPVVENETGDTNGNNGSVPAQLLDNETAVDIPLATMETHNPCSVYRPPEDEDQKGALQKYMEDQACLGPREVYPFVFMLCEAEYPEWQIDLQSPYAEHESKELRDKKPRGYFTLKPSKSLILKELKRRNPQMKNNGKNKTLPALMDMLSDGVFQLEEIEDTSYLRYRERELRKLLIEFHDKLKENEKKRATPMTRADRMRVILLFQFGAICDAYRQTQIPKTRLELDSRNSDLFKEKNFSSLAVAKFNDPSWIPKSQSLPDLHEDFTDPVEYSLREGKLLAEKQSYHLT